MGSSSDDDGGSITVVCTNPNPTTQEITTTTTDGEALISVVDIQSWDLTAILSHPTVKVEAHRSRLVQQSSYFHGLLTGRFSDSSLDCVTIEWNVEVFVDVLKCIYGCPFEVTLDTFLPLIQGALYFGVEMLLRRCETWFLEAVSLEGPPQIQLDDLISIWSFGLDHACNFLPESCANYLARNFMWAISMDCFVDIPYDLLLSCVKNMNLTVDCEMFLSDALLMWLDAKTARMNDLSIKEDDCTDILKQIRASLLPLWFAAEKRSSSHFSKFADESINSIRLLKIIFTDIRPLGDGHLHGLRIRLTKYSQKVNLASCPQITSLMILYSVLPSSHNIRSTLRSITQSPTNLERLDRDQFSILLKALPIMFFDAVQEVDISKCPSVHLETAIDCFSTSFPSLRTLKAAFLLNFKMATLSHLVWKCPMVYEVDLTTDISPIISSQITISSRLATTSRSVNLFYAGESSLYINPFYHSGSSLAKLTLEGRSDLLDSDLQYISGLVSLQYLNLRGCISLTDDGIASVLHRCFKLHSLLVCDTFFGKNSVLALCSSSSDYIDGPHVETKHLDPLADNLRTLHIGGCKCIEEPFLLKLMSQMQNLKTLCLRDTNLDDGALCSFRGSSLEMLDVSNTKVSQAALAHLVGRNQGLKCLKVRGCRSLSQPESDSQNGEYSTAYSCAVLHVEIGRICKLEEIALGWGFSYTSLEALKPAMSPLRKITVGLGASLGEDALEKLPIIWPMLESITLYFQVLSDSIIMKIMANMRNLLALALCHCLGDITIASFKFFIPNLRNLKLEWVTPWMTNNDLVILTESCPNLVELSLLGCRHLDSESQQIISHGWPGLLSIHLEDCGEVTSRGVSSLLDCVALEDLLLRHNGAGVQRNFIYDAASKLPLLRKVSLDMCDASEGDYDIPDYADRYFLTTVKIARCKHQRCSLDVQFFVARRRPVHKETLVVVWNSKNIIRTVVKERL